MSVLVAIPNVLSVVRLCLAIWFPWTPVAWRLPVILGAAFSDLADGYIARRYQLMSWVGGLLDSVADKLFALSVLATFVLDGTLAVWQAPLLLVRDIVVAVIALYAAMRGRWDAFRHMPARMPGKLTTACLFIYFAALAWGHAAAETPNWVWTIFAAAVMMSTLAAVDYLRVYRRFRAQQLARLSARLPDPASPATIVHHGRSQHP